MAKPKVPAEIVEEIELQEPKSIKKTATLLQDVKHTKQFSIKFPAGIIDEIKWKMGDKISIEIEEDGLKLRRAKGD
ncbi:MAG: hypothetical protein WAW23_11815 [Candidatus Methanoperedens sp.]